MDYNFDNPDIIAYINSAPVYQSKKEQFMYMKKTYMEAVVNTQSSTVLDSPEDSQTLVLAKVFVYLQRAETITKYSNEDWAKDYYSTFIINDAVNEKDPNHKKLH